MSPEEIQSLIQTKATELGQTTVDQPNLPNADTASDAEISALRSNHADKVRQLFDHDTQLADVYFQPQGAPAVEGETVAKPEPMLIDPTIGMRASSAQTRATAGELGDILSRIAARKDEIQDTYQRGLDLYTLGLQARQKELDSRSKELDALGVLLNSSIQLKNAEKTNAKKAEQDAIEQKKREYRAKLIGGPEGNRPLKNNDQLRVWLQNVLAANPEDSDIIMEVAQEISAGLSPAKTEVYPNTADTKAAGVAGMPKESPYTEMWEAYISYKYKPKTENDITNSLIEKIGGTQGNTSGSSAALSDPLGIR